MNKEDKRIIAEERIEYLKTLIPESNKLAAEMGIYEEKLKEAQIKKARVEAQMRDILDYTLKKGKRK